MKGHVRKRGTSGAFVADAGAQLAHRCTACRARTWGTWGRPVADCPACGSPLGEALSERRQTWRSGYPTRKAAEVGLRQFLCSVDAGRDPLPEKMTVGSWAERWLVSDRVRSLRPRTRARYAGIIRDDVVPAVGGLQLSELRARHIGLALEHATSRGMSPRSVAQDPSGDQFVLAGRC